MANANDTRIAHASTPTTQSNTNSPATPAADSGTVSIIDPSNNNTATIHPCAKVLQALLDNLTRASSGPVPPKSARPPQIKARRRVTVTASTAPDLDGNTPWIRLCGHWLEPAGFAMHTRVRVHVAHGCLILVPEGEH